MKVVYIKEKCELRVGENVINSLEEKNFYIMSDAFHQKLQFLAENILGTEIPFREIYNPYKGQDLSGRKVLALRHGGGGDILFMTTGLKELKKKFSSSKLSVAIGEQYIPLAENEPEIEKIFSIPIKLEEWEQFHYHLIFENIIENNPFAREYNAYDLFLMQMGLDIKEIPPERKIPTISSPLDLAIKEYLLYSPIKKVGIQVEASSPIRNYPIYNYAEVGKILEAKNYEIYLFGSQKQEDSIKYIASQLKNPKIIMGELRDAIMTTRFMDYFIAPDSMFIHIAGALGVPVIGIYGPFHSSLRMKYFKNSVGIDAKTACSPCFLHGHNPCPKGNPSPCFSLITPKVIMKAFEEIEKKERN